MKNLSILSLILLSGISAESDVDSDIQTNINQNLATPGLDPSDNSDHQKARGTQEDCGLTIELELYDKQVSDKESTSFFGSSGLREVNGPIATISCKAKTDCSKLKLQAYSPDLPWIEDDQTVARSGNGRWKPPLSSGKRTCKKNEIVTGVRCKGKNCGSVSLKCSPLNSKLYQRDGFSKPSNKWTSRSNRKTACGKGSYMVGMECRGKGCSRFRLQCAKIEYKNRKSTDCNGGSTYNEPETPKTCKDRIMSNGQPWSDIDGKRCYDYSRLDSWCSDHGDNYRNVFTANEACCECGGGGDGS